MRNDKTSWVRAYAGFAILGSAMLVFMTGCAAQREYRAQRQAYRDRPLSAYYHHAVTPTAPATGTPSEDPFLAEVEKHLLRFQREWETKIKDAPVTGNALLALDAAELARFGKLASADNLDQTLKQGIELKQVIGLAYARNPKLKAARAALRAALQKYPQAAALDDILHQYNAFTRQLDTKVGAMPHKEMTAMKFPFPDMLAIKGKIVNEEVAIAQQNYEITLRNLIADVRQVFYEYRFVGAALRITQENQSLLEQAVKIAQQKYQVDKGKYGHVIMGQVELSKLSNHVLTLGSKRHTLAARIKALLNLRSDDALGPPAEFDDQQPTADLDALYAAALTHRQEIRRHSLKLNRMALMIDMASRMTYPDATLGASYLESGMTLNPRFMAQRKLNQRQTAKIGQGDAYIREMKLNLVGMKQKLTALEDQTRFGIKKHFLALDTAKRSIALYRRSLLPQAQQALNAAQTAYVNGKMDFIGFIDAQRTLLKVQLGEQKALRDYRTALAELERMVGRALKKAPLKLSAVPKKKSK